MHHSPLHRCPCQRSTPWRFHLWCQCGRYVHLQCRPSLSYNKMDVIFTAFQYVYNAEFLNDIATTVSLVLCQASNIHVHIMESSDRRMWPVVKSDLIPSSCNWFHLLRTGNLNGLLMLTFSGWLGFTTHLTRNHGEIGLHRFHLPYPINLWRYMDASSRSKGGCFIYERSHVMADDRWPQNGLNIFRSFYISCPDVEDRFYQRSWN